MSYEPQKQRYDNITYKRCGKSGVMLPPVSLGLWHNFGGVDDFNNARKILHFAFDKGINHFDLANNYGPPPGSAEITLGKVLKSDFQNHRDELLISTKAGYGMWAGPYGDYGSRKYLMSSLDQSLKRLGLDYVDLFYHHRPDPETPIEETMQALSDIVHSGKALYVGISNYPADLAEPAFALLKANNTPAIIHQAKYNMFDRWVENGLLDTLEKNGVGCIAFSPLAQGMLTDRYLNGIPEGSRASKSVGFLTPDMISEERISKVRLLNKLAIERGQTMAQLAVAWLLRDKRVTSVLVGASSTNQLDANLKALKNTQFTHDELMYIESVLE